MAQDRDYGKALAQVVVKSSLCLALAGSLMMGSTGTSFAQYPGATPLPPSNNGPSQTHRPRTNRGNNAGAAAIGLGVGIILGIAAEKARQRARDRKDPPIYGSPPPPSAGGNGPKYKKPKKPRRVRKPKRTRTAKIVRVALPEVIRLGRPKPGAYRIGFKPLISNKHFVVALKPGIRQQDVAEFLAQYDLKRLAQIRIGLLDQIYLKLAYPKGMKPAELAKLGSDPRLQKAQPSYLYYPAQASAASKGVTEEELPEGLQYAFDKLNLTAQAIAQRGKGVTLAVIDSGISSSHPALADKVSGRFTAFAKDSAKLDTHHGTAVASIIAARQGMRGVASEVKLLSAQVFATSEEGYVTADSYDIARGIDWAVANGANILNLSFAGDQDPLVKAVLQKASERGVISIAAAGNEGVGAPAAYPAAYDNVIAVTATDADDGLYDFANRGGHVEIAAPGVDVLVASGEDGYALESGTSMAAAYISGSVALMLERVQGLSPEKIKKFLAVAARDLGDVGRDPDFGHGLLDAGKAVSGLATSSSGDGG